MFLNVGIVQYGIAVDYKINMERLEKSVSNVMHEMNRPELVVGIEMGLGLEARLDNKEIKDFFSRIAKENSIYFVPCSLPEVVIQDGKEIMYNSLPIFGPDGELIDVYRKICPYYPAESIITRGDRYVIFNIKEKDIKVGVMICHDWCFPEISRNLTLMGAEILLRPAIDPEGLYDTFKHVPAVRALENQAYFISINATGRCMDMATAYGHSCVANPEGQVIYEMGREEACRCIPLDIGVVRRARKYGTFFTEQLVRQIKLFNIPMPFATNIGEAPIFQDLPEADINMETREEKLKDFDE